MESTHRADLRRIAARRRTAERLAHGAVEIAIGVGLAALAILSVVTLDPLIAGGVILVLTALYLARRVVFTWTTMLYVFAATVMFIPIRRYALPIPVGPALEPYRVLLVVLIIAVTVGLLVGSLRWKPVVWGWPLGIFLWTLLASVMVNAVPLTKNEHILGGLGNITQFAFLLSSVLIVRQLLADDRQVMGFLTFLVIAGAVVGFFAVVERFTDVNVFLQLQRFLPLEVLRDDAVSLRAGGNRSYASSQHPIALSVLFCMLMPLALYLMRFGPWPRHPLNRRVVYTGALGLMLLGLLCAVSRTGIIVLAAMFVFALLLRPKLAGVLAAFGVPVLVLAALLLPKLVETTIGSLLDVNSLIASQYSSVGLAGQGRLADLPGAFAEASQNPWFGTGVGSRIVVGADANAQILDDQWLGTLLDGGVVGIVGMIALLGYPVWRLVRFTFSAGHADNRVFLAFALAASVLGFAVAAFFHDSFSFMQNVLVLGILLAVGAWAMTTEPAAHVLDPERPLAETRSA